MWQVVRRALVDLEWDAAPPLTDDLVADWAQTVASLVAVRQALGPLPPDDPIAMLATATTGAVHTPGAAPFAGDSLRDVRAVLDEVAGAVAGGIGPDRSRDLAALNQVAYELAHRVRVQVTDERVGAWLLAGETALDAAIHAPAARSATAAGLAAWQDALAAVQTAPQAAIVQRSVALGHLSILCDATTAVGEAGASGALPQPFCDGLRSDLRELALAHLATLGEVGRLPAAATRFDQAVMLRIGVAVRHVTGRPDAAEPPHVRLDAFLRSGFGGAVLVANITRGQAARPAVALNRVALEYVAHPAILRAVEPPAPPPPVDAPPRTSASAPEPRASASAASLVGPLQPTIRPGTVLPGPTIEALCRARDLGVAAASGDASNPPEVLRGIDPSRWPQLVVEGWQAVTDLVASVIPMVYAQTRHLPNEDLRGQMFVELMGAAQRFDPQRTSPERWPKYAWVSLEHARWRGVDASGTPRKRLSKPRPEPVSLEGQDVASRDRDPGAVVEARETLAVITSTLDGLPDGLLGPLVGSMEGHSHRAIADDAGFSESTARRRISQARDQVRDGIAVLDDDARPVPNELVSDPVLERSQRLFEQSFGPVAGPAPGRGLSR